MGAYLSQPKTDKVSTDERNDYVVVGASSMQGWRNSQEDAHNSILDFDEHSSFFAVYDGHGGAEVATYCADKLPHFLKQLAVYKDGNFEQALKDAFLGFDQTLLDPQIVDILKMLAGTNIPDPDSDGRDGDEDVEDLAELHEESNLPLDEVLEKYKGGGPSMPALKRVKDGAAGAAKPQSPYLRGRRAAAVAADAANKAVMDPDAKPEGSSTSAAAAAAALVTNDAGPSSSNAADMAKVDAEEPEEDSTVSSSSSGASKTNSNNATGADGIEAEATATATEEPSQAAKTNGSAAVTAPISSSVSTGTTGGAGGKAFSSPDSSLVKETDQNGSVTSSEAKALKADVTTSTSSSSSAAAAATATSPTKSITATKCAADEESAVSGSSDTSQSKQNGNVGNCASSSSSATVGKSQIKIVGSAISSTSKSGKKNVVTGDDDSTDDDADYDAENSSADENDATHYLEYSSEDDDMDDDDDDDDDDDEDMEEDDDEEDEDDEENEDMIANERFCASMIEESGKDSGCTAVVAFLNGRDLYVANAGDSRCVVSRNGKAIEMSLDHKPEDDEESERIIKAGGRVTLDGRVNGGLNLSRAIGDHAYKMNNELQPEEQMISALPDIKKLIISDEDEFMVLACDGIWNYMSSEEVVDFVSVRLRDKTKKISEICEDLFDNCLAPNTMGDGTGCDNMTAVIVCFQPKILELPTKIKTNETEDVLAAKRTAEADAADASLQKSLKRCASPTAHDDDVNSNEAENANKTKRLKTDDGEETTSSTTINNTPITNKSNGSNAATSSTTTDNVAEQKECDSVSTAEESTISST